NSLRHPIRLLTHLISLLQRCSSHSFSSQRCYSTLSCPFPQMAGSSILEPLCSSSALFYSALKKERWQAPSEWDSLTSLQAGRYGHQLHFLHEDYRGISSEKLPGQRTITATTLV